MTPIVEVLNVTKAYRGSAAIKNVSISFEKGEIHALLGENGAGKSTLTKMIAGVVAPTLGEIRLNGEKIFFNSPLEALQAGIAMVFQETSLVPSLTVAQNIYLGREKTFNRLRGLYIAAQQFLQSLNFPVDPTLSVSQLGAAQKQMVEIARAVHFNAKLIIFDEPTATLTPEEKRHFFALINRLKSEGVTIVFISHALEEALQICDRITVLRDGLLIVTDKAKNFDRDAIIRAMVGRALSEQIHGKDSSREPRRQGKRILSVQNLSMGRMVKNSSFSIFSGQITGIFGLIGSGRTEMLRVVSGVAKRDHFYGGEIFIEGKRVRFRVPRPAMKQGVIYITEDRKLDGFFETMSISENIYLSNIAAEGNVLVSKSESRKLAEHWTKALNIRAIDGNARVIELSGGNQQKVVIAKSLSQWPKLVIFDEPTRGVDVGAIAEIHDLIHRLADEGIAVVVISSYLPEILNLSDRILVSRKGRIVEEFDSAQATEEKIMYAAVH